MNDLIAHNLRTIRREREYSLDKLASLSGVSKSMLRQIEMGKSNPTIATLWKIANGLHIPLTALLQEESAEVVLKSFADGALLKGNSEGCRLFTLVPFDAKRAFEIYYMEIEPDAVLFSDPHNGRPEEYLFVIQGGIELTIDDEQHMVSCDQFLRFNANRAHKYENKETEMARAIVLITYLA